MENRTMPKLVTIFTVYPIETKYKNVLEREASAIYTYMELNTLRKKGVFKAIILFNKNKTDDLKLHSGQDESNEILSVLKAFSLFSKASNIYIHSGNGNFTKVSKSNILVSLFLISKATILGFRDLALSIVEVKKYNREGVPAKPVVKGENILYLNMNLWYGVKVGGSVGHVAGVINELNNRGNNVCYAAISESTVVSKNVNQIILKGPTSFGLPPEINNYRFDRLNYKTLKKICIDYKPSFIYQRLSVCNYTGAKLAQELKIPLVIEYNGSEVWTAKHWGRPLIFEKMAKNAEMVTLKKANVVVTISEVLKDELIERGVNASKVVYYPNCIDPLVFNPERFLKGELHEIRKKHDLSEDAFVITFLGTFGQWHGVDVLANAIVELKKNNAEWLDRQKVKFLLIGDGLKMTEVKKILETGDAFKYCILTGLVAQHLAPAYLAASNLLVSPHVPNPDGTKFFGSPTKLFEYLAMNKPIIASDLEQIGEVLKNSVHIGQKETIDEINQRGRVACLTEPGNVSQLCDAIVYITESKDIQKKLGDNARNLAISKYTWEKHVDEIVKTLS
jgi:glycosyltransferase involved in cell wall biosynthesis